MEMDELHELLERYEALGEESIYGVARAGYEAALSEAPDNPRLLLDYGYLLECHGRNAIRASADAYRRAIELDPAWFKPRMQLMSALVELRQPDEAVATYRARLAAAPDDVQEHRYLATAYLGAGAFTHAEEVIRAGLKLEPDDTFLTEQLGEVCSATDRPDEALKHWRRALELDPGYLASRYGAVFLLEKEGRFAEAAAEWRLIIDWHLNHDDEVHAAWPKRELARLESQPSADEASAD